MDILGKRFGRLVVMANSTREGRVWAKCDCGRYVEKSTRSLVSGNTRSCGCLRRDAAKVSMTELCKDNKKYKTNFYVIQKDKYKTKAASGRVGVYPRGGKWVATIYTGGRSIFLGSYTDKEDAIKAREFAEIAYQLPLIEARNEDHADIAV